VVVNPGVDTVPVDRSDCSGVDPEAVKPDVDSDDKSDCNDDDPEVVMLEVEVERDDNPDFRLVEPVVVVPPVAEPELDPTTNPALNVPKLTIGFTLCPINIAESLTEYGELLLVADVTAVEDPVVVDEEPIVEGVDVVVSLLTLMAMTLAADACNCSLRAVASRSLRRTLLLTPLRSLWTQLVNWALVGSEPRIDS
jgi:hypothetical protein